MHFHHCYFYSQKRGPESSALIEAPKLGGVDSTAWAWGKRVHRAGFKWWGVLTGGTLSNSLHVRCLIFDLYKELLYPIAA